MSFVGQSIRADKNGPKSPLGLTQKQNSVTQPLQKQSDRFENEEFLEIEE